MSSGICGVLLAISEATLWGWGSVRTLAVLAGGILVCCAWVAVESRSRQPLIDMTMMRIRGVWTTNLTAFLLGAGMYSSFIVFPQFAQLPKSTGFGFGASVVASGLYLLPSTLGMVIVGFAAGAIAARFGSKLAAVIGSAITAAAFALIAAAHAHPYDMLASAALLGIGIGLAFAALGNLVVQAVDIHQTGAAGGMNTVMRTIGGAIGGQIAATLIADHTGPGGLPAVTGFTDTFVMATGFLIVCTLAGLLIPSHRRRTAPDDWGCAFSVVED
jgi:MFS family permease